MAAVKTAATATEVAAEVRAACSLMDGAQTRKDAVALIEILRDLGQEPAVKVRQRVVSQLETARIHLERTGVWTSYETGFRLAAEALSAAVVTLEES